MTKKQVFKIFNLLLFITVFCYLLGRSITVTPGKDEAETYLTFISENDFGFRYEMGGAAANNHILNTILAWVTTNTMGLSNLSLRLPNLLLFGVFFWFLYRLSSFLKSSFIKYLFIAIGVGAHYLIEFFAYSRGYGMSIALLTGSIFYLFKSLESGHSQKNLWYSLLYISLATLANLNILPTMGLIFSVILSTHISRGLYKKHILYLAAYVLVLLLFVYYAFSLKSVNAFYPGHPNLYSAIWAISNLMLPIYSFKALNIFLTLSLVFLVGSLVFCFKQGAKKAHLTWILLYLFIGNVLGLVLLDALLGFSFPSLRTGLHWYLLFAVCLVFLADQWQGKFRVLALASIACFCIAQFVKSVPHLNIHTSIDPYWASEQIPSSFYSELRNSTHGQYNATVYSQNLFYTYGMAFQDHLSGQKSKIRCQAFENQPEFSADYAIVNKDQYATMLNTYQEIKFDPFSKMSFLKRIKPMSAVLIEQQKIAFNNTNLFLFNLASFKTDTLQSKSVRLNLNITIVGESTPIRGTLNLLQVDSSNVATYYRKIHLTDYQTEGNSRSIAFSHLIDSIPKESVEYSVFLENSSRLNVSKLSSKIELLELID